MKYDLAVIGSGFGGTLSALIAQKKGLSVLLIEKDQHPRFAIGESTTPLTNLYLEEISRKYELAEILHLSKWGSWQKNYPEVPVGLKRGFSFFHHDAYKPFEDDKSHRNQLLVAANPHSDLGDTHWYRPDFDHLLVKFAQRAGIEFRDNTTITDIQFLDDEVKLETKKGDHLKEYRVNFIIDATGPNSFLNKKLNFPVEYIYPDLPDRQGLYAHFRDVGLTEDWISANEKKELPYHPDDAAIHHIFDEGWIWVLRFNNGIISAGVSLKDEMARKMHLEEGAPAWKRLLNRYPSINKLFKNATVIYPFKHLEHLSYRCDRIVGKRWAMLPSAAGFIDPLMSMGFPLNLRGIMRLTGIFDKIHEPAEREALLNEYEVHTKKEQEISAKLVAALYAHVNDFELFSKISLLYFAAASYSESAIRLGKPELAKSFLLYDHPVFGEKALQCYEEALNISSSSDKDKLIQDIFKTIQIIDVAGFGKQNLNNWYPVDGNDMIMNAQKLHTSVQEINNYLHESGFYPANR
jgi:FADH2 O2-dependent halogenase